MPHEKIAKTNAARLLDRQGIPYVLPRVAVDESDLSALTVAARLGVDPAMVFKTLVARADRAGVIMACIPACAELDPRALAAACGSRHAALVPLAEVRPLTGYMRGGCSPLAAKKAYPVLIDESALMRERIFLSAGLRGVQLELSPRDAATACGAVFAKLARD